MLMTISIANGTVAELGQEGVVAQRQAVAGERALECWPVCEVAFEATDGGSQWLKTPEVFSETNNTVAVLGNAVLPDAVADGVSKSRANLSAVMDGPRGGNEGLVLGTDVVMGLGTIVARGVRKLEDRQRKQGVSTEGDEKSLGERIEVMQLVLGERAKRLNQKERALEKTQQSIKEVNHSLGAWRQSLEATTRNVDEKKQILETRLCVLEEVKRGLDERMHRLETIDRYNEKSLTQGSLRDFEGKIQKLSAKNKELGERLNAIKTEQSKLNAKSQKADARVAMFSKDKAEFRVEEQKFSADKERLMELQFIYWLIERYTNAQAPEAADCSVSNMG
jgi:hypothetical protein